MNREVPFDKDAICDICGAQGAFDFMGDFVCPRCNHEIDADDEDYVEVEE